MAKLFNQKMIKEINQAIDWKQAIANGVDMLVANNYATSELLPAILASNKAYGAYYVLEKGLALVHTAPGPYAKKAGVSFQLLKNNIQFNNEDKWARFIFTLVSPDAKAHLALIAQFGKIFMNQNLKEQVLKVTSIKELQTILEKEKLW